MSVLLGLELLDDRVHLTVVDRRAAVVVQREEPLATPVSRWWEGHPEERTRAVTELVATAVRDDGLRPAEVAAIGLSAEASLVLLDPDFVPIPPREIPWGEVDPSAYRGRPWEALSALLEATPNFTRRVGVVLDLVGFLRFRLTGALATDLDFAWSGGHVRSAADHTSWDVGKVQEIGFLPSQLPPIFPAPQKVSVVGEQVMERTGLRRGTWVCGGGDPLNTRLLFAAEPVPGNTVVCVAPEGVGRWEVGGVPDEWSAEVLPTALDGVFLHRRDPAGADPRGELDAAAHEAVFDWSPGFDPGVESWSDDLRIAPDAGRPSAGTAIIAGLGLGWWRDPRPIWRKRRPPRTLGERRAEAAETAATEGEPGESHA